MFVKYFFSFFSTFFRCRLAEAENTRLKQLLTKLRDLLPQPHGGFHKDVCRGFTTLLTLSSVGIFIIAHSVLFVKRFLTFFKKFSWGKAPRLWEFTNLALLTLLSIPQVTPEVKHFGKNKKIIILRFSLDKNVGVWYNGKFRAHRSCARRWNLNQKNTHD